MAAQDEPPPRRLSPAIIRAEVDHGTAELIADPDRPLAWTLLVNDTAQSHVDLSDPTHLEFEYVRRLGHVLDAAAPPTRPLRVLHLGGGAWTLPRYVAATRPGSWQRVVELDGALVDLVAARLPADGLDLDVRVGDARYELEQVPDGSVDVVVVDVFAGARIPSHLTSVEFVRGVARVLDVDGIHAANLADGPPLHFARAQVATAAAVFPELALLASPEVLRGRRFGNLVLAAGRRPLPVRELTRAAAADPFRARVESGRELCRFAAGAQVVTDRTAGPSPVPPPGFFGRPAE
ncbi:spermidine synthase [Pseudonocardia bannensis]|uniref:Fused MFS/spermidine synthase n=1 Tax=Pseudonocardia bannensis TaxID=630973 RepID=A0A848DEB5_9PSEU|nr:fused MFS/spermidine synthase [Pseudonocardia bannensis]NMH90926.1 fused MFS/spermidine synthase [Pseudonocardia bannensis]